MKNEQENQKGSVTLETSIVLPIFIFIFLFILGLFSIVSAQNQMTHALVQASNSLALDSYLNENVDSLFEEGTKFWGGLPDMVLDLVRINNDPNFSSRSDWYNDEYGDVSITKERFAGFLAGNVKNANNKLKNMKVIGGINGIVFVTEIKGEDMTITMKYQLQFWFDFFGLGKISMNQSVTSRLWK